MNILILTGPTAAGKNTVSDLLAKKQERCAVIDVDLIRWMYRHPHKGPWDGEEGKWQQRLGVENACLLAKNFVKNGSEVIILDVLLNDTAELYKQLLKDYDHKTILLLPSYSETHRRFTERKHTITEEEFKVVYEWQEKLETFDEKIDNTNLSAEEVAEKLRKFLIP